MLLLSRTALPVSGTTCALCLLIMLSLGPATPVLAQQPQAAEDSQAPAGQRVVPPTGAPTTPDAAEGTAPAAPETAAQAESSAAGQAAAPPEPVDGDQAAPADGDQAAPTDGDQAVQDTGEESSESTEPGEAEDDAEQASLHSPTEATPAAGARRRHRIATERKTSWWEGHTHEMLAVAALLALLLVARIWRGGSRQTSIRSHQQRSAPLKPEELGWAVFQAVRDRNLDGYRALYLNGAEAAQTLGREEAEHYLDSRTHEMLEESLRELASRLSQDALFQSAELGPNKQLVLSVKSAGEELLDLPVGTTTRVGAVLRLVMPAPSPPHPATVARMTSATP